MAYNRASLQDQEYLVALKEVFTKIDSIASTLKLSEATESGITKYKVELSKMLEGVFLTREA